MVKEMRLRDIKTIPDANHFLNSYMDDYNNRFSVSPKNSSDLFKEVPASLNLKRTFALSDVRTIGNDFTIRWNNRLFLLLHPSLSLKGRKIQIKQALNGDLRFDTKDKTLAVKEVSEHDLQRVKKDRQELARLLKQKENHPKSKTG